MSQKKQGGSNPIGIVAVIIALISSYATYQISHEQTILNNEIKNQEKQFNTVTSIKDMIEDISDSTNLPLAQSTMIVAYNILSLADESYKIYDLKYFISPSIYIPVFDLIKKKEDLRIKSDTSYSNAINNITSDSNSQKSILLQKVSFKNNLKLYIANMDDQLGIKAKSDTFDSLKNSYLYANNGAIGWCFLGSIANENSHIFLTDSGFFKTTNSTVIPNINEFSSLITDVYLRNSPPEKISYEKGMAIGILKALDKIKILSKPSIVYDKASGNYKVWAKVEYIIQKPK